MILCQEISTLKDTIREAMKRETRIRRNERKLRNIIDNFDMKIKSQVPSHASDWQNRRESLMTQRLVLKQAEQQILQYQDSEINAHKFEKHKNADKYFPIPIKKVNTLQPHQFSKENDCHKKQRLDKGLYLRKIRSVWSGRAEGNFLKSKSMETDHKRDELDFQGDFNKKNF